MELAIEGKMSTYSLLARGTLSVQLAEANVTEWNVAGRSKAEVWPASQPRGTGVVEVMQMLHDRRG
jgi:hypothetical protein